MAESADAPDSGSGGSNTVCVQVTLSAPKKNLAAASVVRFFIALSYKSKCTKGQHCDTCTINSRYSITEQRLNIFILFYDFGTNLSSYPKESAILQTIFRDGLTALLSILDIVCCVLY